MRRILIFGGTTEGRLLAQALSRRGVPAAVSVATVLGAEELSGLPGITPLVGRRTAEEMAALLSGYDKCVDATHPYAREVSANIRSACRSAGVPLRRLLRRSSELPPGSILAGSPEEAAQLLQSREGNVLLAIGAKGVSAFSGLDPERLYPRVLPVEESLSACRRAGIPTKNIIAMHGPHPYAREVSANIRSACRSAGVPLRRLLRRSSELPPGSILAGSPEEAAQLLQSREGNVLLAIGAKGVSAFSGLDPERLYPRVLPVEESLSACRRAGIPTKNIIAMHGPFSQKLNEAILEQYRIRWMVTKDGGSAGGFGEKVSAAQNTGVSLVVIGRPEDDGEDLDAVLEWVLS